MEEYFAGLNNDSEYSDNKAMSIETVDAITAQFKEKVSSEQIIVSEVSKDVSGYLDEDEEKSESEETESKQEIPSSPVEDTNCLHSEIVPVQTSSQDEIFHFTQPEDYHSRMKSLFTKDHDALMKSKFKEIKQKIHRDRETLKQRKEKYRKQELDRLMKEVQKSKELEEERLKIAIKNREEYLKGIQDKIDKRKAQIEANRQLLQENSLIPKPKYKRMFEKYIAEVELPIQEKNKLELARKKLHSKMNHDEIRQHILHQKQNSIERIKKQTREARDKKIDSALYSLLIKKPQEQTPESKSVIIELKQKKKMYSQLVKEMFLPKIGKKKQSIPDSYNDQNIENSAVNRSDSTNNRSIVRTLANSRSKHIQKSLDSDRTPLKKDNSQSGSLRKHDEELTFSINPAYQDKIKVRLKAQSVVPEPLVKQKDYLHSQRNDFLKQIDRPHPVFKINDLSYSEKTKKIKNLENLAKRNEIFAKSVSPARAVKIENEASDMLVESIRAKLSLLNN